jgi:hypothetical protein
MDQSPDVMGKLLIEKSALLICFIVNIATYLQYVMFWETYTLNFLIAVSKPFVFLDSVLQNRTK